MSVQVDVNKESIARFCREHGIRRLALFGSAVRTDFRPDSDVDVLVDFDPEHVPGLLGMARLERELSAIFGGRRVDLRTPEDLSRYFRDEVVEEAEVQWIDVIGMRHRLVHMYFDINLNILWQTVQQDLPFLITELESVLEE